MAVLAHVAPTTLTAGLLAGVLVSPEPSREARSGIVSRLFAAQRTQASAVVGDLVRMRALMPLLMKNRNGGRWTPREKAELLQQLRILSRVSPYLLLLLLPGSALLLPVYAWWLDRRGKQRKAANSLPPCG